MENVPPIESNMDQHTDPFAEVHHKVPLDNEDAKEEGIDNEHEGSSEEANTEREHLSSDGQWMAEGHVIDKHTGEMMAYAVSYENQRWYPVKGWSSSLLPTDRFAWSSEDGIWERSREDWPVPSVWGHLPQHCKWRDAEWQPFIGDTTDAAGWEYAVSFGGVYSAETTASMCVRRRAWRRSASVLPEFFDEKAKSDSTHTIRCACMNRLIKHEEDRCRAYNSETTYLTSLQTCMGSSIASLKRSTSGLKIVYDSVAQLQSLYQANSKAIQKIHAKPLTFSPRSTKKDHDEADAVSLLVDRLASRAIRGVETAEKTELSIDSVESLKRNTDTIKNAVDDLCDKHSAICRKSAAKLTKTHHAAASAYAQLRSTFMRANSDAQAKDLWDAERVYSVQNAVFLTRFNEHKTNCMNALTALQDLHDKTLDMIQSSGSLYDVMLRRMGYPDPSGSHWSEEPAPHEPSNNPTKLIPLDYTKVEPRKEVAELDCLESALIYRKGCLKCKGVMSYTEYLAVLTVDAKLFLFTLPLPVQPLPLRSPAYTLDMSVSEVTPKPEGGEGYFKVQTKVNGYLSSTQTYKFLCQSEEEMVDWVMALKHRD